MRDEVAILWQRRRGDCEPSPVLQIQCHLLETRLSQHIAVCCWTDRIKAHRREEIPSRHLSGIVVARETAWRIVILRIEDMRHTLSRLLWFANEIIEIGYLMTGFVAVPISSFGKHRVELGLKLLLATQHLHQSIDILRHIPSVMTSGTFRDIRLTMDKVLIILEKTTIRLFPTHLLRCMTTVTVACLGVNDMTPIF